MSLTNQLAALATLIGDRLDQSFGDLSPRAASALLTLLNHGPLDVSALARIVGTTQPTATRLIDGLERQGLVERSPREGRVVSVRLTSAGDQSAGQLQSARHACAQHMLASLTEPERQVLAKLVDKLLFSGTDERAHAHTTCRYCDHGACNGDVCPINRKATEIEAGSFK